MNERKNNKVTYIKSYIKYIITLVVMNALKLLWIIPMSNDEMLYLSFDGKQYSDSPKYICEEIRKKNNNIRITWLLNDCSKFEYLRQMGYEVVNRNSFLGIMKMLRAKIIVTNNHIPTYIPIRKNQILLNTWHGGSPLKTVGFAEQNVDYYFKYFCRLQNIKYTAFLSSSKFVTNGVLEKSFDYHGTVLEYGMPRNAVLLSEHDKVVDKVYDYFNIEKSDKNAIILYAPTFRGNTNAASFLPPDQQFDIEQCVRALNKRFEKNFYFLFRAHHTMVDGMSSDNYINATDYPDMQELLCAADVLLTDYSSCMGDMALMKKPVFLYTPDLEEYIEDRGFYWDIYSLPFPISKTNSEFMNNIISFDEKGYIRGVEAYLERLGSYESSDSLKRTVKWLIDKINK